VGRRSKGQDSRAGETFLSDSKGKVTQVAMPLPLPQARMRHGSKVKAN